MHGFGCIVLLVHRFVVVESCHARPLAGVASFLKRELLFELLGSVDWLLFVFRPFAWQGRHGFVARAVPCVRR